MSIYVNRTLNFKQIKTIGFDMDHTLVRYHSDLFEKMTFQELAKFLVFELGYPKCITEFPFKYNQVIRGLAFDKKRGNLLKLSLHGKVKAATHGLIPFNFQQMKETYNNLIIDFSGPNYASLDTSFSVAAALMFGLLVEFIDKQNSFCKTYEEIFEDISSSLNLLHNETLGPLKNQVAKNLSKFIIKDLETVAMLERMKKQGKTLAIITNSDHHYTRLLLTFAINPFLKEYADFDDLFDYIITKAEKPKFFTDNLPFLKVDKKTGLLNNWYGPLEKGIYQGGNANLFLQHLGIQGDEILYFGDHIYGDVVSLKLNCNWRTALVVEELDSEIKSFIKGSPYLEKIDKLMIQKENLELDKWQGDLEKTPKNTKQKSYYKKIKELDDKIGQLINQYQKCYNYHWGPIMRAGQEESRLAFQIAKYACIYMEKINILNKYSHRHYFRPKRRPLPYECDQCTPSFDGC